jgi:hypothetical protein
MGPAPSQGLIKRLDAPAQRPGHQLIYSVGWELGERERTAITAVPGGAWQIVVICVPTPLTDNKGPICRPSSQPLL